MTNVHPAENGKRSGGERNDSSSETGFAQQLRDILESLAVALFLAFLFKTFEAEAFVIPTGSMAPTLKGRHKDVVCDQCGYQFQTNASEEMDASTNSRNGKHVVAGVCPQCWHAQYFGDEVPATKNDVRAPSWTGDRILVSKLTFDQRELHRFDVSVFRAPAEPKINFIKRIVGLPDEDLRIQYGDLFVRSHDGSRATAGTESAGQSSEGQEPLAPDVSLGQLAYSGSASATADLDDKGFAIARKEYKYLRQIMQVVHDADYPVSALEKVGWPERWSDEGEQRSSWRCEDSKKGRSYFIGGDSSNGREIPRSALRLGAEPDVSPLSDDDPECSWLRYRHIIPTSEDWANVVQGRLPAKTESSGIIENNPRLIDDFAAYNAGISRYASNGMWRDGGSEFSEYCSRVPGYDGYVCKRNPEGFGYNWVGDLGVSCDLTISGSEQESDCVIFDLVKGGVVFRCVVAPKSGLIALSIPQVSEFEPVAVSFPFKFGAKYRFEFFNVDEEMRVVIDGDELVFSGTGGQYDHLAAADAGGTVPLPRYRDPSARDLAPAAIGVRGATVRIGSLKLLRDVYYIAAGRGLEQWDSSHYSDFGTPRCDRLVSGRACYLGDENEAAAFMSSPDRWTGYGRTKSALLSQNSGQYVALGDNSAFSLDSRLWARNSVPHYVDRKYLIGKAFYVYWPHGKELPVIHEPWLPNIGKMRHID